MTNRLRRLNERAPLSAADHDEFMADIDYVACEIGKAITAACVKAGKGGQPDFKRAFASTFKRLQGCGVFNAELPSLVDQLVTADRDGGYIALSERTRRHKRRRSHEPRR